MSNGPQPNQAKPYPQQPDGINVYAPDPLNNEYGFLPAQRLATGFVPAGSATKDGPSTSSAPFMSHPHNYNPEDPVDEVKGFAFSEKSIRQGFIRKVYAILMAQLTITASMIALFVFHDGTRQLVDRHLYLFWIAFAMTFVVIICMACCSDVRRKAPMNFIFLFVFTICQAFLMGTAACRYEPFTILMAAGLTAVICLALTVFAFQTKWDFTMCGAGLFIALIVFVLAGIILSVLGTSYMARIAIASAGALIFSLYLIYDTQIMIGGDHKYAISPEEYIFAALNLYLDVVNIFMHLLMMGKQ